MLCNRVPNLSACSTVSASRPAPRMVVRASAQRQQQAGPAVAAGLAAVVLASQAQPAQAVTPTVGSKIGEGATLRGNNGFESKAMMEEFKQKIAERTGKAPPISDE